MWFHVHGYQIQFLLIGRIIIIEVLYEYENDEYASMDFFQPIIDHSATSPKFVVNFCIIFNFFYQNY